MSKYSELKRKFKECDTILGTAFTMINCPTLLPKINEPYLDFMLFDTEHGTMNNEDLVPMLQICRMIDLPTIVRVPSHEYAYISRAIDMGADGIMIPRTETMEQLERTIRSMRFVPKGIKGHAGHAQMRPGETYAEFQEGRFLIVQIESPKGIALLPEMLERYGDEIAAILVGPYDLSSALGDFLNFKNPAFLAAVEEIFSICKAHGKSVGIFCDDRERAEVYAAMGANMLWISLEDTIIREGMRATILPFAK